MIDFTNKFYKSPNSTAFLVPKNKNPEGKSTVDPESTEFDKQEQTSTKQQETRKIYVNDVHTKSDIQEMVWCVKLQNGVGGGTSVSIITGISLFYDWVPYHYVCFKVLMIGLQTVFDGWNTTSPHAVSWSLLYSWWLVFGIYDD